MQMGLYTTREKLIHILIAIATAVVSIMLPIGISFVVQVQYLSFFVLMALFLLLINVLFFIIVRVRKNLYLRTKRSIILSIMLGCALIIGIIIANLMNAYGFTFI